MKRKKIVWLCSWYPCKRDPFNGDFIQRHAIAASLFNDITVIHVDADPKVSHKLNVETNDRGNLREILLSFKKRTSLPGRFMAHFIMLKLYRKVLEEHIRAHGKPDVVHVHVPVWAGLTALWLKRKYKVPYVLTEHWGIYNDIEQHNYNTKSFRFRAATKSIFTNADAFLSVSRYIARGVNQLVVKKEFDLMPNVVNTEYFFPVNKHTSLFRFIHVSTMIPLKNVEGILKAFKVLTSEGINAELVMVGPVPPAIKSVYEGLSFSNDSVKFTGEISYPNVAEEMRSADCLVLFSNIENSPCVIGEALCCGLPVISTDVGGIPELLDASNSILVRPGDQDQLVAAMKKMIGDYRRFDPGKIATVAKEKFSYAAVGKIMDDVYVRIKG